MLTYVLFLLSMNSLFIEILEDTQAVVDYVETWYQATAAMWFLGGRNFFYAIIGQSGKRIKIYCDDIYYIEAMANYSVIHCRESRHVVYVSLKEMQSNLPIDLFIRIHKSYIVNIAYINEIEGNHIILDDDTEIVIGKTYKNEFYLFIDQFTIRNNKAKEGNG